MSPHIAYLGTTPNTAEKWEPKYTKQVHHRENGNIWQEQWYLTNQAQREHDYTMNSTPLDPTHKPQYNGSNAQLILDVYLDTFSFENFAERACILHETLPWTKVY